MTECLSISSEPSTYAITMKNSLFYWSSNEKEDNEDEPIILKNINLKIKSG